MKRFYSILVMVMMAAFVLAQYNSGSKSFRNTERVNPEDSRIRSYQQNRDYTNKVLKDDFNDKSPQSRRRERQQNRPKPVYPYDFRYQQQY